MEAYGGLVAGSHSRNELVVICQDGDGIGHLSLTTVFLAFMCYNIIINGNKEDEIALDC